MENKSGIPFGAYRQSFELFEQFAEAVMGWDIGFRQLAHSISPFQLEQLSSPQLLYCRAKFGCSFHQLGGPVLGFRTFALRSRDCTDFRWCDEAISSHDLIVYPVGGEFESASRPGFDIFTVSLSTELLEQTAQTQFHRPLSDYLETDGNICHRPGPAIFELRQTLHQLSMAIGGGANSVPGIEATLAYLVLACLDSGRIAAPNSPSRKRTTTLRLALSLLDSTPLQEITAADLASKTGACRRTLEHAFRDSFDLSPAAYIKMLRLKLLNRELLHADRSDSSVGMLCQQHGFHHRGQLAADYLAMFGERPLATLQR